ncbi:MAG: hypothetical protein KC416_10370, partial [Myxococcales bacterium]|nr:hypothetical protein [Myxococcales bacterium]
MMAKIVESLLLSGFLLIAVGCSCSDTPAKVQCETDEGCGPTESCVSGICLGPDGGSPVNDASSADGGTMEQPDCDPACGGGEACVAGLCCAVDRACADDCCEGSEICFANACVTPGSDCRASTDCGAGEYCEFGLGDEVDEDAGTGLDGGAACGTAVAFEGVCL